MNCAVGCSGGRRRTYEAQVLHLTQVGLGICSEAVAVAARGPRRVAALQQAEEMLQWVEKVPQSYANLSLIGTNSCGSYVCTEMDCVCRVVRRFSFRYHFVRDCSTNRIHRRPCGRIIVGVRRSRCTTSWTSRRRWWGSRPARSSAGSRSRRPALAAPSGRRGRATCRRAMPI